MNFPDKVELRDYTATVIATGEGMDRELLVNGIGMTKLTPITKMIAHLPLTMLGRTPSRGLVICFGMGTTFRSMLTWDIPATVVDLVPSCPKAPLVIINRGRRGGSEQVTAGACRGRRRTQVSGTIRRATV